MQRFAAHGRRSATIPGRRDPPNADHAPGGHAQPRSTTCSSQRGLPLPVFETLPKTTKITYEVCHSTGDRHRTRASSLHCGSLRALRCTRRSCFFFCRAMRRLATTWTRHTFAIELANMSARSESGVARARELATNAVWQPVCPIGSCTGVPSPVGVCGGGLERRCVLSGRADPLCGSMYGAWVPDTCGPFHTRIASRTHFV